MDDTVQRYPLKEAIIRGLSMAYVDVGEGDPIVFLHGNPTSSYLWRDVMPHLADLGRCIAPDLIGMGHSAKLPDSGPGSYRFAEHRRYLDLFLDALAVDQRVTLVVHDWGGALGFDWARRNPQAVQGIVYMETIVKPFDWSDWPDNARSIFQALRSDAGEEMALQKNVFVERILPASIIRKLSTGEMAEYRYPYRDTGEARRPTLSWPRELPIDGSPPDVHEAVQQYSSWLATSPVRKLFINADPGSILVGAQRDFCRTFPNQTEQTVKGIHFIQEDSPADIGIAIRKWLQQSG